MCFNPVIALHGARSGKGLRSSAPEHQRRHVLWSVRKSPEIRLYSHRTNGLITGKMYFDSRRQPTLFFLHQIFKTVSEAYETHTIGIKGYSYPLPHSLPQLVPKFKKHWMFTSTGGFIMGCKNNSYHISRQAVREQSDIFV